MSTNSPRRRLAQLRSRLEKEPTNGLLWLKLGSLLHHHFDESRKELEAYRQAAKYLPSVDLRLLIGRIQCDAGEVRDGLQAMRQVLRKEPSVRGFCFLSAALLQEDRFREAERAARRAVKLNPKYEEAYFLLAKSLRKSSRPGQATKMFKKAVSLDPNYAHAWSNLGEHLTRSKRTLHEALKALAKAIELNPGDGWAKLFMANSLGRLGRFDEADAYYRDAIRTYPDYPDCRRWYKEFLDYRKRFETEKPRKSSRRTTSRSRPSRGGSGRRSSPPR